MDGTASVIILKETIENLGGKISSVYFPDREKEGYGVNKKALGFLKKYVPALLIALDCGISNFNEAKLAKKLGFDLVIIDHHEVLDKIPEASIVVDPQQKGDRYPFKRFATVGIVFKLSEILLKNKTAENLRKEFLELTALATIADMMPREKDNKILIDRGLEYLEKFPLPGLKVFFEIKPFRDFTNLNYKVSQIIAISNVRDGKRNLPASFRLLTNKLPSQAKKIVKKLLVENGKKKEKIREIIKSVEERIIKEGSGRPVIFIGDSSWKSTLYGLIASIICHKYQKPVFIFKIGKTKSQGSVRMPKGKNGVSAMKSCSKLLEAYGGHPLAAGFRVKNKNLEQFKECLIKYFKD